MDRFPEAFERFESVVDVGRFKSYMELTYAFRHWAGQKWMGTPRQWAALGAEAENLGFDVPDFVSKEIRESRVTGYYVSEGQRKAVTWRHEIVNVQGKLQNRYRDIKTGRFVKKTKSTLRVAWLLMRIF